MPSMQLPQETCQELAKALEAARALRPCTACGSENFAIQPFIGRVPVGSDLNPRTIPCAVLACRGCGLVRMHALSTLGLSSLASAEAHTLILPEPGDPA